MRNTLLVVILVALGGVLGEEKSEDWKWDSKNQAEETPHSPGPDSSRVSKKLSFPPESASSGVDTKRHAEYSRGHYGPVQYGSGDGWQELPLKPEIIPTKNTESRGFKDALCKFGLGVSTVSVNLFILYSGEFQIKTR